MITKQEYFIRKLIKKGMDNEMRKIFIWLKIGNNL